MWGKFWYTHRSPFLTVNLKKSIKEAGRSSLVSSINWLNVSKLLTITSPWVVFPVYFDTGEKRKKYE